MPFKLLSNTVFNHPAFGSTAKYYAGGSGVGVDVQYVDVATDAGVSVLGHDFVVEGKRIRVRKAEISSPQSGDKFVIDGQDYFIKGEPQPIRNDWSIEFGG